MGVLTSAGTKKPKIERLNDLLDKPLSELSELVENLDLDEKEDWKTAQAKVERVAKAIRDALAAEPTTSVDPATDPAAITPTGTAAVPAPPPLAARPAEKKGGFNFSFGRPKT